MNNTGEVRVKLTIEWGENGYFASDILLEWPHVKFVVLLLYYIMLKNLEI